MYMSNRNTEQERIAQEAFDRERLEEQRLIGYARVSTVKQKEDRQVHSLEQFGVKKERLYVDKASGKDFDRMMYLKLLEDLRPGDVLVLHSIDRLGRNYEEIMEQWRLLTKELLVDIVILDMPLLDTRKKVEGELLNTFVADIVLQIMSYVAQNERETLMIRQREGIEAARRKGVQFGRPRKQAPPQYPALLRACREEGSMSVRGAARKLGVSVNTFRRWEREMGTDSDTGNNAMQN